MTSASSSVFRTVPPPPELRVVNWPLAEHPIRCGLAMLLVLGVSVFAYWMSASVLMGLLCWLALVVSLWRLWIPVRYEFTPQGIIETLFRRRRVLTWRDVISARDYRGGIQLMSDDPSLPLAGLRGVYIRWGKYRTEIIEWIDWHFSRQDGSS